MILESLFKSHPHSVGETYLEHQRQAFGFGGRMILAGFACILHGLLPAMFLSTGSRTIASLHERMVTHRSRQGHHRKLQQATG